ncbi:GNAT family N-acetyltransferase [Ligilactobacillus ceti]|uniref:N-acetyltransferase domain-containing protein n=1 Tax=Ligilactobacillus ceti DSM 22408 TaxID=1122146 RepID=A0A0R2KTL1_9LACO|nr:GNAT family N-acetyltransferase [Ligilactobacillus ceti]KRN89540.1 hypothetical protein IV53_GL001217 [Ligilactobacillus ceti DSM 22408]
MQITIAKPFGKEHVAAMTLRQDVLGTIIDVKKERKVVTFIALDDGRVVGTASLQLYPCKVARIRQVAVSPDCRGKRIGQKMIQAIEDHCRNLNYKYVILTSRVQAVPFYQKMDYTTHFFTFADKNENRSVNLIWMKKVLQPLCEPMCEPIMEEQQYPEFD